MKSSEKKSVVRVPFFSPELKNKNWKIITNILFSTVVLSSVIFLLFLAISFAINNPAYDTLGKISRILFIILASAAMCLIILTLLRYMKGYEANPLLVDFGAENGACEYNREEKTVLVIKDRYMFAWQYYILKRAKKIVYLPNLDKVAQAIIYPLSGSSAKSLMIQYSIRYGELSPKNIMKLINFFGSKNVVYLTLPTGAYRKFQDWTETNSQLPNNQVKAKLLSDLSKYLLEIPVKITTAEFLNNH